jgi:hypothetical protein
MPLQRLVSVAVYGTLLINGSYLLHHALIIRLVSHIQTDSPIPQSHDSIRHFKCQVYLVQAAQDRDIKICSRGFQRLQNRARRQRIEAGDGFVRNNNLGLLRQGSRYRNTLLLTA